MIYVRKFSKNPLSKSLFTTWNYNTNRNNMQERSLLYAQLFAVGLLLRKLKYFGVMLKV